MEGGDSNLGVKTALLTSGENRKRVRFVRRNSVNSFRNDFMLRLPDEVRTGLDAESPFDIDVSRTKGLTQKMLVGR
ncbi:metal tolerance protein 4-like [Gossypium australe]|uniref:Metal tolerance protein 4-like n=1 Tax=Gossypium australe TaxID=47621 RepID=A0A5B6WWR9_9ROSI|nr:metal tolerance protein 4-like [Gossypium australe]